MDTKYLIIDGNYMMNRMIRSGNFDHMFNKEGVFVGGVYGTLNSLYKDTNMFHPQKIVFVFDKGHSKRRLDIYPDYKHHHKEKSAEDKQLYKRLYDQIDRMKDILDSLGVHWVEIEGKEGDDICYNISWYFEGNKVLVSDDKDYVLMIAEDVSLYRPIADEYITYKTCRDIIGFTPAEFLFYKIVDGDGSDNIDGVYGVSKTTIRKLLDKIDTPVMTDKLEDGVYEILEKTRLLDLNKREKEIFERLDILDRNLRLIDFDKEIFTTKEHEYIKDTVDHNLKLDIGRFISICKEYEFNSILQQLDNWVKPFERIS